MSAWRRQATEKDGNPPFPAERRCYRDRAGAGWAWRLYIVLIEVLGYLVDTFLFVVFLVRVVEREKWPLTLTVAVVDDGGALHHLSGPA